MLLQYCYNNENIFDEQIGDDRYHLLFVLIIIINPEVFSNIIFLFPRFEYSLVL